MKKDAEHLKNELVQDLNLNVIIKEIHELEKIPEEQDHLNNQESNNHNM